jgi:polyhydroxyalkanoate synthase
MSHAAADGSAEWEGEMTDTAARTGWGQTFDLDPAAVQQFAMNLARASIIGQQAVLDSLGRRAGKAPVASLDPLHIAPAMLDVFLKSAGRPEALFKAQADLMAGAMDFWQSSFAAMWGGAAAPKDKRFSGEAWSHPLFDVVRRAYLVNADWLNRLAGQVEASDPLTKRRIEFFTRLLTDVFSPSNFLGSNPEALEEAVRTRGESLVRGMRNFADDLKRGGGELSISQTDMSRFAVGENMATTPGKIVFQNDLFQLIQYAPTTDEVRQIPLLLVTSWINKYYILDLQPANSMIAWLTGQGFTVFVTSWVNPDQRHADKTFEHYMVEGAMTALAKVMEQTGAPAVNTVGYCIAGTLLSCTMAWLAAKGVASPINSATFFAAQQDFSDPGDLSLFTDEAWLRDIERLMDEAGGVLPGSAMGEAFNVLRANDLILSFLVNNYLMGKTPRAFDLLFWNADQTRLPKALGLWYLKSFYQENLLARGLLELGGVRLDLSKVTTPIFVQSSKEDHIAPCASIYRGARLFGGPVTYIMAGSGHIAGVVNHPDAKKYQHWVGEGLPETLEGWRASAQEVPGSWWPTWAAWLHERSGEMVPARDPAAGPLVPIEDAPGSYVKVMSNPR